MIHFTEAMTITMQFVLDQYSYKDLIFVLKIVNDCDCFMLFAKLFQSQIVFGKKDLENDSLCIVGTRKELFLSR